MGESSAMLLLKRSFSFWLLCAAVFTLLLPYGGLAQVTSGSGVLPKSPPLPQSRISVPSYEVCSACINQSQVQRLTPLVTQIYDLAKANPAFGARQTMAVLYQSCDVLEKPPYDALEHGSFKRFLSFNESGEFEIRSLRKSNLPQLVNRHYYLKDLVTPDNPICRDVTKNPPVYNYGARPNFKNQGQDIEILAPQKRKGEVGLIGLDCSAFVSVAMSTAGLKFTTSVNNAESNMVTSHSLLSLTAKNSCLERPMFEPNNSLKSGDILAMQGHALIIDRVGSDPFGIKAMKQEGSFPKSVDQCSRINPDPDLLNFTIIQSGGYGDKTAMVGEAKVLMGKKSPLMYSSLRDLFKAACQAEFKGSAQATPKTRYSKTALLRHKGVNNPECVFAEDNKPKLLGQECTGDCLEEAL